MSSERSVLHLVGLIYDAAGNASLWPRFLREFGKALHAPATNIFAQDLANHAFNLSAQIGVDPPYNDAYQRHYRTKNVYLIRGDRLLRSGNVLPNQLLCPDADAFRSEFYNEWIVPQKQSYGLIGVISRNKSLTSMTGAIRFRGMPPFGEDELALVRMLMPHLQRAVALHRRIAELETQKVAATRALDCWSLGVVLLDAHGRVLFANCRAEEIARARDGFTMTTDGLSASLPREGSALRAFIHDATATRNGAGGQSGGALALSRPSLKRPLNVLVTPLFPNCGLAVQKGASVAVFLSDPELGGETPAELLRRFYSLTPAEASLAALLAAGEDLHRAAECLGITMNTARTHLKRIFDKTGTKRQAGLVGLVLRSPAGVRLGHHPFGG